MIDKFRRKLAKLIAPKPVKRVKKAQEYTNVMQNYGYFNKDEVKGLMSDKSYQQFKRNKQSTVVGIEQ